MVESNWESEIYSKGQHINRYPFGEVISLFFNSLQFLKKNQRPENTSVLELGSGAGNNLWFFAENGFQTTGIDASETACQLARDLMQKRKVNAEVINGVFENMPFEDSSFDIIVDRQATYCGTMSQRQIWWKEIDRVLKHGGIVISFSFNNLCRWAQMAETEEGYAEKVDENCWSNFSHGAFEDTGTAHLASIDEIKALFSFLDIQKLLRHSCVSMIDENEPYTYDEWVVVGVKS